MIRILTGDCRDVLKTLADESVHCVVTSPPYWGLRDYGIGQGAFGLESTYQLYVEHAVEVFREVRRVLRKDGTLWLNLGDSYAATAKGSGGIGRGTLNCGPELNAWSTEKQKLNGTRSFVLGYLKPKDLCGIPWRVAFALQADGWWLRQDIIWSKPNPMPESVTDRCTKAHEYVFLLSKSAQYYYDAEAIAEPAELGYRDASPRKAQQSADKLVDQRTAAGFARGVSWGKTRNKRSVWEISTAPFSEAHFATFPPALIEPCVRAGCPKGGTVLDPFGGAGTTGLVADRLGRNAILIELNPAYTAMAERRIKGDAPLFAQVETREAAE